MAVNDDILKHQLSEERRLTEIESEIKEVRAALTQLQSDVADLVSAWKAASWLVATTKWIGGIAISITAIAALLKGVK